MHKFKKCSNILTVILVLILVSTLIYLGYRFICKIYIYPIKYSKYVQKSASDNNIDPYLIFAIIKKESKFNNNSISKKNAKGLMQVLDTTAKEISKDMPNIEETSIDLFDPETNILIGTKYFKTLLDRYNGNISLAICAYNAGLGNVDKWLLSSDIYKDGAIIISNIPFEETKMYLVSVLNYYNMYVELYK